VPAEVHQRQVSAVLHGPYPSARDRLVPSMMLGGALRDRIVPLTAQRVTSVRVGFRPVLRDDRS
jgi:hypothetical protein